MKTRTLLSITAILLLAFAAGLHAQPYTFTTIAGSPGQIGSADGDGKSARFNFPECLTVDASGTVYVSDHNNHTIRQLTRKPDGNWSVRTIAGFPRVFGLLDGTNTDSRFYKPEGIVADKSDNLYVEDAGNTVIRKLTRHGTNWVVSTITPPTTGAGGWGLTLDHWGNLYLADQGASVVRRYQPDGTNWVESVLVGAEGALPGVEDGTNTSARLGLITGIAVDAETNLYVGDRWTWAVHKVSPIGPDWVSTTIVGLPRNIGSADGTNSDARFFTVSGVAIDSAGTLFVADRDAYTIRKINRFGTNWVVSTIGGLAFAPAATIDGTGSDARFNMPSGIAVDSHGTLYISEMNSQTIRIGQPFIPMLRWAWAANHLALSWPLLASNYVLEQSASLVPGSTWDQITTGITTSGTNYTTTRDTLDARAFYRLHKN